MNNTWSCWTMSRPKSTLLDVSTAAVFTATGYWCSFVLIILGCYEASSSHVRLYKLQRPIIQQLTVPLNHLEGPHWDAEKQLLVFVDISDHKVYQYNPYNGRLTFAHIGATVGAIIPIQGTKTKFLVGASTSLAVLTWNGQNITNPFIQILTTVDRDKPGNRFNDGKADAVGRLWIGTMGIENPIGTVAPYRGTLYRAANQSCQLEPVLTGVSISNGIVWSLDNRFMYYIDSPTKRVEKFDYNLLSGALSNRRTLIDFEKANILGIPDGMTIDNKNNLWIACWGGSQIVNVDSNTGKILYAIKMPVERVTSLAFGGEYYDTLFVTTMKTGLTSAQLLTQPSAGALFSIHGLPVIGNYNNPAANCARVLD